VRVLQSFRDSWIGVGGVVDVVVEVRADGDGLERHVREVDQHLAGKARLGDCVVLEVELGGELQELRPVGTAASAHDAGTAGG
jgi:hypothetical protein